MKDVLKSVIRRLQEKVDYLEVVNNRMPVHERMYLGDLHEMIQALEVVRDSMD